MSKHRSEVHILLYDFLDKQHPLKTTVGEIEKLINDIIDIAVKEAKEDTGGEKG